MKNKKFLLIALFSLIILSLTGCSNKDTTSYQTPLGEVAYLADIDYKLKQGNITSDISINVKVNEEKNGKTAYAEIGYYEDEYAKKEFTAIANGTLDKVQLSTTNTTFTFSDDIDNTAGNLYLVLHVGTSLDSDQKAYRNTEVTITFDNTLFEDHDETDEGKSFGLSRYANTMSLTETVGDDITTDVVVLNQLTGISAFFSEVFGVVLAFFVDLFKGKYWIGLLVFTLLIRTLGWPIYAKTNSTSQGMSKIQPEIDRINRKYEGKNDQNSKMKQQMEMREVMKKNKVSMWGCLLPFVQMPIFIVVYEMVRKFPCTPRYDYVDYNFLGADLGAVQGNPKGNVVLAILVGVTMIATQLLSTYFQKRQQKKRENFYTRQKAQSQKQANMTLIIMTVVMTGMMVAFAWNSAGMAFYWIIGNVYQLGQTLISKLIQAKKEEKEDLKNGKVRGRD